eukprot:1569768-Rhodomonas_salina.2
MVETEAGGYPTPLRVSGFHWRLGSTTARPESMAQKKQKLSVRIRCQLDVISARWGRQMGSEEPGLMRGVRMEGWGRGRFEEGLDDHCSTPDQYLEPRKVVSGSGRVFC